jgi:hypothetical protein
VLPVQVLAKGTNFAVSVVTRPLAVTLMQYHASLARHSSDEMHSSQRHDVNLLMFLLMQSCFNKQYAQVSFIVEII